ncbi:MAG: hypothetical protein U1F27_09550 [Turneriella sp.]
MKRESRYETTGIIQPHKLQDAEDALFKINAKAMTVWPIIRIRTGEKGKAAVA